MKRFKNQDGSTLMVVMVFVSLLAMMGLALITTSAAHLRYQKSQEERKSAFYISESGIDEVIAGLTERMQEIHLDAVEEAGDALAGAIERHMLVYEAEQYNARAVDEGLQLVDVPTDLIEPGEVYLFAGSDTGTINQDNAFTYAEAVYKEKFRDDFEILINGDAAGGIDPLFDIIRGDYDAFLAGLSYQQSPYDPSDPVNTGPVVGLHLPTGATPAFVLPNPVGTPSPDEDTMRLPFYSFYNSGQSSRKLLTVELVVSIPEYKPLMLEQNVMRFDPNILWTKALTTDSELIVNGAAEVFGNVYAFGDSVGEDGVLVGNSANLTVQGEVVTARDVRFGNSGSTLEVSGNLYARNVVVDENQINITVNTDGIATLGGGRTAFTYMSMENGQVTVPPFLQPVGDMVVENNLELRGISSDVNVSGQYVGFMDPTNLSTGTTSCVIIDTPMDGTRNTLTIEGDTVIGGIAFLRSDEGIFNTGESIAINENFYVYKNMLTDLYNGSTDGSGNVAGNYFTNFVANTFPVDRSAVDDTRMRYWNPFDLGLFAPDYYDYENTGARNSDNGFDSARLADYFFDIASMTNDPELDATARDEDGNPILDENDLPITVAKEFGIEKNVNFGNGIIDMRGAYYSFGVGFNRGGILPGGRGGAANILRQQQDANEMYYRQIYGFGDLLASTDLGYTFLDANAGDRQGISRHFNIGGISGVTDITLVDDNANQIKEIIIVSDEDVVVADEGKSVRGVIVTSGNVTINGSTNAAAPLDFRGTIIAGGNIAINGFVRITNDRDFIAKAMATNGGAGGCLESFAIRSAANGVTEIWPTYSFKTYRGDTDTITRDDFVYVNDKEARLTEKYNSVKDLVRTANWNVIEY